MKNNFGNTFEKEDQFSSVVNNENRTDLFLMKDTDIMMAMQSQEKKVFDNTLGLLAKLQKSHTSQRKTITDKSEQVQIDKPLINKN